MGNPLDKVVVIETDRERLRKDASEVLASAMNQGYSQVLVMGMKGDGNFELRASRTMDAVATIGAIEHLKAYLFRAWNA